MYRTRTRNYLKDSQGDIWLSFGELNSLIVFNHKQYRIHDLFAEPSTKNDFLLQHDRRQSKNVWIAETGCAGGTEMKDQIDTLIPFPKVSKALFNYMQILDCDENNNLWLASFDNEILQYDCTKNKMYLRLPENSYDRCYSVTNSSIINNHIWLGMANEFLHST
jgi:hypothetical protein